MTHTELEHQIRDIIRTITNKEYIKPIIIRSIDPEGYEVGFELYDYKPIWYSATLPDDQFIKFITKELCNAKFLEHKYAKAERNTTLDRSLNKLISPYDTARINPKNK